MCASERVCVRVRESACASESVCARKRECVCV